MTRATATELSVFLALSGRPSSQLRTSPFSAVNSEPPSPSPDLRTIPPMILFLHSSRDNPRDRRSHA